MSIRASAKIGRIAVGLALLLASLASQTLTAQLTAGGADRRFYSLHGSDNGSSLAHATEPLTNCGDSLSAALQQGTPQFPCWANIRTVDRWNSASIGYETLPGRDRSTLAPRDLPPSFTMTAGGLNAFSLPEQSEGKAYGGLAAISGLVQRRRWQLMGEDVGGAADFQQSGAHFVGLNLAALRATGEITPRLTWQGSATNTYGTDAVRQVAPLDYRMIGQAYAPAPDTAAYGLHTGLMTEGEEGLKIRYQNSRRSAWDFSATHNYTKYNQDAFLVHAARARVEYLRNVADHQAVGLFAFGGHQTRTLDCTIGGAGARLLSSWGSRSSLNVSGGIAGANPSCGKRVQFIGNAAVYTRLSTHTDLYLNGNRDLGNAVLEHTVFLSTGGAGVRQVFGRGAELHASLNELYGTDPLSKQTYHGAFIDGSLHYRLGLGFSQELELRRYQFSGLPEQTGRTAAVFTLWWSPPRSEASESLHATLR